MHIILNKDEEVLLKIEPADVRNVDITLATVIHATLVEFKEAQNGWCISVNFEDLPADFEIEEESKLYDDWVNGEKSNDYLLDTMIYAFGEMRQGNHIPFIKDDRIEKGLELFSKYFTKLWI